MWEYLLFTLCAHWHPTVGISLGTCMAEDCTSVECVPSQNKKHSLTPPAKPEECDTVTTWKESAPLPPTTT